ncbi:Fur family transcriptional regulator [Pseudonocardia oroxyli]|uniref:Fur family transcriptional regulator, ferric uptake regulator n=1 Tax=Pseudonocardia oroxyli TaxID=366584 RepID=A0A1G7UCP2_PSEOR|nr:Fur family transcriptional regulator [Pseudonocardia oroxyli]SDG45237.1 Fur family transcriptional regulator, ferric uptake regulator [Pseudonocardia oroxyli]
MSDLTALLRERGLRSTPHRRAVLYALAERPHVTANEVASAVARTASGPGAVTELSRQGLYNVLEDLRRVGLVRSIEPAGSPALFELQAGDNHHHAICRSCGAVQDVPCSIGAAPCLDAPSVGGFVPDEAEIVFWGRCAACATSL